MTERHGSIISLFAGAMATAILCIGWTSESLADSSSGDECRLVQLASLDMETDPDGTIAVPAAVNDHSIMLLVDTGSNATSLSAETVREFGLTQKFAGLEGQFFNGVPVFMSVMVDSMKLGNLYAPAGGKFVVLPEGMMLPSVYGMLGPDIMQNYDVEFDFYQGKFNIFQPHKCDNAVVYWTTDNYTQLSMHIDESRHIVSTATLDGKPINVIFDTGSSGSLMSIDAARLLFGWDEKDPGLKALGTPRVNGRLVQMYTHPFSLLDLNGVQVKNPIIDLAPGTSFPARYRNDAQVVLGLNILRQLHVYIAYPQQAIYLTSAEASRPVNPAPTSKPPATQPGSADATTPVSTTPR